MSENTMFRNIENRDLDCRLFGYISDFEGRGGFCDLADIYLSALGNGEAETEMPIAREHMDIYGVVNNGAVLAVAEAAMLYSVYSLDAMADVKKVALEYVGKGQKGDVLIAVATVTKRTDNEVECSVTVKNQYEKMIAHGSGSYLITSDFVYTYADYLRKTEG